jgi:hypothetical protein
MRKQDLYYSPDFLTASILFYHGYALENLDKSNPKKIVFCFLKNKKTDRMLEKFHKGELKVEPCKLANIQRELKRRMFS